MKTKILNCKKRKLNISKVMCFVLSMIITLQMTPSPLKGINVTADGANPRFLENVDINGISLGTKLIDKEGTDSLAQSIHDKYDSSYNSEDTALIINTIDELIAFVKVVNNMGRDFYTKFIKLTRNINLNGTSLNFSPGSGDKFSLTLSGTANNLWTPIGTSSTSFKGTFDGGNYKITNMLVVEKLEDSDSYAGLFGNVDGATIKNIGVSGASQIIGYCNATSSSPRLKSLTGGLIGYTSNSKTTVINSYVEGDILSYCNASSDDYNKSTAAASGLVGFSTSEIAIENSYSKSNVYSVAPNADSFAGELLGYDNSNNSKVSIINSYSMGDVYSSSYNYFSVAGGLIGRVNHSDAIINNSYAEANVSSFNNGLNNEAHSGGILGYNENNSTVKIMTCHALGNAFASSSSFSTAGGIIGRARSDTTITDSYSKGNVSSNTTGGNIANAGGFIGCGDATTEINSSYSTGSISSYSNSTAYKGGLVGNNYGSLKITNGYWDKGVDDLWQAVENGPLDSNSVCESKTLDEMKDSNLISSLNSNAFITRINNTPTFKAGRTSDVTDSVSDNENLFIMLQNLVDNQSGNTYANWIAYISNTRSGYENPTILSRIDVNATISSNSPIQLGNALNINVVISWDPIRGLISDRLNNSPDTASLMFVIKPSSGEITPLVLSESGRTEGTITLTAQQYFPTEQGTYEMQVDLLADNVFNAAQAQSTALVQVSGGEAGAEDSSVDNSNGVGSYPESSIGNDSIPGNSNSSNFDSDEFYNNDSNYSSDPNYIDQDAVVDAYTTGDRVTFMIVVGLIALAIVSGIMILILKKRK